MTPAFFDVTIRCAVLVLTIGGYFLADGRLYVVPAPRLLWSAAAVAAVVVLAVAAAMFTSVWGESTRDMRYTLAQVLPVWFLLTPVLYPLEQVPEDLRAWMAFNPMTPFVETFRWGLLGVGRFDPVPFVLASVASVLLLAAGIVYFARVDRRAADAR
jgi:lipopolysaccharide transport system permease protein